MGGGKRIFLEWYEDDELEISIQRESGLGIEEIGLTEKQAIDKGIKINTGSNLHEAKIKRWDHLK